MFDQLPQTPETAFDWTWDDYAPYYNNLLERDLNAETVADWLADFSRVSELVIEVEVVLYTAKAANTADTIAKKRFFALLEVMEKIESAANKLQQKLLDSGLEPEGFEIPLREMRGDVALFREENLPLITELQKLGDSYDEISGAQTVQWKGQELTVTQARAKLNDPNRQVRQQIWEASYRRQMEDVPALNELWVQMFEMRQQVTANADKADFRDYVWQARHRFDYTPDDNMQFLKSIRETVVPAMTRMLERRKRLLKLDTLRPWDMMVDPTGETPLTPFKTADQLIAGGRRIFDALNADLAAYYASMQAKNLLDLDNRANKAPGGYCAPLPVSKESIIFMNAVGIHDNVQTLLHEAGHAFHNYASYHLPYVQQQDYPTEFAEVASMAMELLAAPNLNVSKGGFYTERDAARARTEHLESCIYFWCYMSVVDSFQHWAYTHPADAVDTDKCDAQWANLWDTYLPGVDWSGHEDIKATGWQRKLHIYHIPFYYLEYGLAQMGAGQVWRNSLTDYDGALQAYRYGLSLGNTRKLPELFEAAGAKLAFDTETLGEVVELFESTINALDS